MRKRASTRSSFAAMLVAASAATLSAPAAAEGDVRVAEYAWTSSVRGRDYTNRFEDSSAAPVAQIFFWTRLEGSNAALEALRRDGKLPIRHQWRRYVGTIPDFDNATPLDEMPLDVGRQDVIHGLELELLGRGFFDWRTWSTKHVVRPGFYTVRVLYADGGPVPCLRHRALQPDCRFSIELR
jgi:hypothetical protein